MTMEEVIGLREMKTPIFYRRLVAEFLGTAILVVFGCGSALTVNPPLAPTVISIAVAFGLTVATVIWSLGNVSGAHINPAVSVAMFATRKISLTRCVAYIIVQCLGGIVGGYFLWGVTPSHRRGTLGVTLVADEITVWQGLVVEIIATFVLVLAIFASVDSKRTDHSGSTALSIGLVVTMDIPWAIQYTGASMNPARSLGPCVPTGLWQEHWVFWVGPILGALVAGLLYEYVFAQRHQQEAGQRVQRHKVDPSVRDDKPNHGHLYIHGKDTRQCTLPEI
ncbi:aquaporin-4-like [Littorina saxatilis]|uniref:aquaporin-4-like n=1 Tax=Littorina saxatilis TaxID=31220 RepID=UPI0038B482DA